MTQLFRSSIGSARSVGEGVDSGTGRSAWEVLRRRGSFLGVLVVLFGPASARGELQPMSALTDNCYNFPEDNFDPTNSIVGQHEHTPYMPLEQGGDAIDFVLHDTDGKPWVLSEVLEEGLPVVMIWGMLTCPAFQGLGGNPPFDKCTYWDEYGLVESYKHQAKFVHLYGPEPHPRTPGTNFDYGIIRPQYWSSVHQQRSYQERLGMVEKIQPYVHPEMVILPDYLPGNPYSSLIQPVWCTYAQGARPVTIVSPEGEIWFQRGWLQTDHVASAIEGYWNGGDVDAPPTDADEEPDTDTPPIS